MATRPIFNNKKLLTLKKIKLQSFTLIELVAVIVLTTIIAATAFRFVDLPILAYMDAVGREEIVSTAEIAFARMTEDFSNALPNSVRVKPGNPKAVQFINVVKKYRYRASKKPGRPQSGVPPDTWLNINNDDAWNVFTLFPGNMLGTQGYRVVLNNLGAEGANSDQPVAGRNAYSASNGGDGRHVITASTNTVTLSNFDSISEGRVELAIKHKFPFNSQDHLHYFIAPVSYICDTNAGTLTRYANYAITEVQPVPPVGAGKVDLLAKNVSDCSFIYYPNAATNSGILNVQLEFTFEDKKIKLFEQITVSTLP